MQFKVLRDNSTFDKIKFFNRGEVISLSGDNQKKASGLPQLFVKINDEKPEIKHTKKDIDFSNLKKDELKNILNDKKIDYDELDTKKELLQKLQ